MNPQLIITVLFVGLAVWMMYRRVRRNFGRQPISEARLGVRTVLLAVIGALMVKATGGQAVPLGALAGGAAVGAVIGFFALRHTTFEATPEGRFYTPHTYFGLAVTALVLGRLGYRMLQVYGTAAASTAANPDPLAGLQSNPVTLGVFGLLIGYYVLFNVGVIRRGRALAVTPAGPAPP